MAEEKRGAMRVPGAWSARMRVVERKTGIARGETRARVLDASATGMLLAVAKPAFRGTTVEIDVAFEENIFVSVRASVMRVIPHDSQLLPYALGVHFTPPPDPETHRKLRRALLAQARLVED